MILSIVDKTITMSVCVCRQGRRGREKKNLGVTLHEIGNFMLGGAKERKKIETGQLSNRWVLVAR